MKKAFYLLKNEENYFLESIDTGSIFSLGKKELDLLKQENKEIVELLQENKIIKSINEKNDELSLMLLVNDYCNLKCDYCFEKNNNKTRTKLSNETLKYILTLLKNHNNITFTGGEPLLNFSLIKNICNVIEQKKLSCEYSLITNGVLFTKEIFEFLNEKKFDVQISLDGCLSEENDKIDRTNRNIEKKIIENVLEILSNYKNIKVKLRINFSKNNIKDFSIKMESLIKKFSLYLDNITFDMKIVDLPLTDKQYMSFTEKYEAYILFYEYLYNNKITLPFHFVKGGNCMARNKKIYLFDCQGNRYPCFSFVGNNKFIIEKNESDFFVKNKYCKKECVLHDICFGGCMYENYCDTGKLVNQCDYDLLNDLNIKLFLYKLGELKYLCNPMNEVKHVETFFINI